MKSLVVLMMWALALTGLAAQGATAQQSGGDGVWVQIEAHPSLSVAQERARSYASEIPDVNGFSLGGSWYGIALGPYDPVDAQQVLQVYRDEGKIPRDSYITGSSTYGRQFWPIGANVITNAPAQAPQITLSPPAPDPAPVVDVQPADETPAEARQSERNLLAEERKDLQRALQWGGFYNSGIDGAFGPGTRRSMREWQSAYGFEPTGILTTRQRAALMAQFNEPLTSVGMRRHVDSQAGISMDLPMSAVTFAKHQSPFAHYDAATEDGIRVLLISQAGDGDNLFGMYDILQSLSIVPLEGPRTRGSKGFTIEGRNARIVTHVEANIEDGEIKGFILVWPTGDERRRARVLDAMQQSFARIPGVLDPLTGADEAQSVDLVSGLEVRKPVAAGSGFFVDTSGSVVTTAETVQSCTRVTLDEEFEATIVTVDAALGVAVLRPTDALAPVKVARLANGQPRLQSDVAVAGYSYGGLLGAPTLTFGTLADIRGLRGEAELTRLALAAQPGDSGGPILDAGGSVVGMLLPQATGAQQLPQDVRFAAKSDAIRSMLDVAGLNTTEANANEALTPQDLAVLAEGMTVLVSCWE